MNNCQWSHKVKGSQKPEQHDLLGLTTKANLETPAAAKIMRTKNLA